MPPLLQISDLSVEFQTPSGPVRALHGVDLQVDAGDSIGLVGESGSGKSLTCLSILGLAGPGARTRGAVWYDGQDLLSRTPGELERIRGREISMIFQDPACALNPVMSIGDQVAEAVWLNRDGIRRAGRGRVRAEAVRLLDEVGIPQPERRYSSYPHELSGGQTQRVMIAMMLAGEPRLLIADEPTTALDVTIQAQILALLTGLCRRRRMALILVTHDLGVVAQSCGRVAVLYGGRIVETGPTRSVFPAPQHPYTAGLIRSRPHGTCATEDLFVIDGAGPAVGGTALAGCAFEPRCHHSLPACRQSWPRLAAAAGGRVACFNPVERPL